MTVYEKRDAAVKEMKSILAKSEREKRSFTTEEQERFESLEREVEDANGIIRAIENARAGNTTGGELFAATTIQENTKKGLRALRSDEPISSVPVKGEKPEEREKHENLSIGKALRGMITGNWEGAEEEREAMNTLAGGAEYVIPSTLSGRLIDLARNQSSIMRAGALTVPMDTKEVTFARAKNDPTAVWKPENEKVIDSSIEFDSVKLEAKTLMAMVKMSIEMFEDATNIDSVVENAISEALSLEMDKAFLRGNGNGKPLGLRNQNGINILDLGANGSSIESYVPFSKAVQKIKEQNGQPNAAIYSARTDGEVDRLVDSTGQPLNAPESFKNLRKITSNQVPDDLEKGTSNDASEIYIGAFNQAYVGIRRNIVIEVSRDAGDAFERGQVWVRAYLRGDFALAKPSHFTVIDGVIPKVEVEA